MTNERDKAWGLSVNVKTVLPYIKAIQKHHKNKFGFKMTQPAVVRLALKHFAEHLNAMEKANDK
jgi:hypothetical protein